MSKHPSAAPGEAPSRVPADQSSSLLDYQPFVETLLWWVTYYLEIELNLAR
jgi:hypothetical protein